MSVTSSWNKDATFSTEICWNGDQLMDIDCLKELPESLYPYIPVKPVKQNRLARLISRNKEVVVTPIDYELIVDFHSIGYNDPGQRYGGPHGLGYPPEGDDERTLVQVYLKRDNDYVCFPKSVQDEIFELFKDEIEDVDLE